MSTPDWLLDVEVAGPLSGDELAALDAELERRVGDRIGELERLNAQLQLALEQKTAAQEAQAHSDAHFRAAFESDAVGQVHLDPKTGLIIRANRCYAAMLGYEPAEMIGIRGSDLTWPDDKTPEPWTRLRDGKVETYSREKRYTRRDGTPVWTRVSASLVRTPGTDAPLLAVAMVEDIDDRKRAELALEQATQDLEAMVEQRTAALAQRDLLLREVYHRVKNNLQIVDSLMLMQARRLAEPEAKAALETLRARIYALGLVHHQLMGSSDLETFAIAPFLQELSTHLLEGFGGGGVALTVRAPALKVDLDFAIPLGLLVTELVTNAIKHAFPDGRGAIEVALDAAEPGWLNLTVADDGAGYAADERREGSLGASIIDGLVHQLKGTVAVTTGPGTRCVVRLPAPGRA
jgi:PAS domain S-box-containing protein